jgi:hypothetical protein
MSKTTTLGLVKPTHGINEVEGETGGVPNEAVNLDVIDAAITALQAGSLETVPAIIAVSGAITQKQGAIRLGSSGALAMTLADPVSGGPGTGDDGKRLSIFAATAHAHVVTVTGGLAGGTNNTVTLGGAVGDMFEVEALAGKWFIRPSINATQSHV